MKFEILVLLFHKNDTKEKNQIPIIMKNIQTYLNTLDFNSFEWSIEKVSTELT